MEHKRTKRTEDLEEFEKIVRPLIKWLNETQYPHVKIIIDSTNAELVEGLRSVHTEDYVKD